MNDLFCTLIRINTIGYVRVSNTKIRTITVYTKGEIELLGISYLDSFWKFNTKVIYYLSENLDIFLTINNLFDTSIDNYTASNGFELAIPQVVLGVNWSY